MISEIGEGKVFYIGFERNENPNNIHLFVEELNRMILSNDILETDEILILSQFTLLAKFKGLKPSFHNAEDHQIARNLFYRMVEIAKESFPGKIQCGIFGEYLQIELELRNSDMIVKTLS